MSFVKRLRAILSRRFYAIGYGSIEEIDICEDGIPRNVNWIKFKNYKINWIADPYLLSENETSIDFLVEEWIEKDNKGRLVKFTYDKKSKKTFNKRIILELTTHLSFPSIIKEEGNIYICPENAASDQQKIYKYNIEKELLEEPVIIIDEALLDVNIVKINSSFYAFGIKLLKNDKGDNNHLLIYKSDNLLGHYTFYQEITNPLAQERGAGSFFIHDKKLIRPVQNCEGDYGRNVIFKEVTFVDGVFKEKVIGGLYPTKCFPDGLHTFNILNDKYVIDGMAYNVGKWMTYLKRMLNKW